jgi:hypothetical protein
MEAAKEVRALPAVETKSATHNIVKERRRKMAKAEGGAAVASVVIG